PLLTDTILEIPIPQPTGPVIDITPPEEPESPLVVPKGDKGKDVIQEEATKVGVDPKILASAKGGQEFKKIQDAEKRKHMELEPEIRVTSLECNKSLPEGVPFIKNMVIEEPEYEMFFIDVFGDETFQRMSDINKVGVDALLTYLVMAYAP
ncbi:hypothetical protein Tco_1297597, partial [Tanacetum coccineum]